MKGTTYLYLNLALLTTVPEQQDCSNDNDHNLQQIKTCQQVLQLFEISEVDDIVLKLKMILMKIMYQTKTIKTCYRPTT